MTVKTNIAAGLKAARKAAKMNVNEVGAALGKSGKTISAWEVGRGQPDGDELILLCKLLNVHLRDFYGDEYNELVEDGTRISELLSAEELEVIECMRGASDAGRAAILSVARALGSE